jgi:hypothetical protein
MKSSVFWDVTPYSPMKVNRSFGEEHISSIFCLEEFTNVETSRKKAARRD